jgi:hypothetical protein
MVAVVTTVTVPAVTTPVDEPMDATALLLLVHVPPAVALLSAVVCPEHTASVPVMAAGSAFTVISAVIGQPVV